MNCSRPTEARSKCTRRSRRAKWTTISRCSFPSSPILETAWCAWARSGWSEIPRERWTLSWTANRKKSLLTATRMFWSAEGKTISLGPLVRGDTALKDDRASIGASADGSQQASHRMTPRGRVGNKLIALALQRFHLPAQERIYGLFHLLPFPEGLAVVVSCELQVTRGEAIISHDLSPAASGDGAYQIVNAPP